jgi:integrase
MMGNNTGRRRRFGAVRELKSGQFQARYRGPDGLMRPADRTFPSKTDAEIWLTRKEAEILNGEWINPDLGRVAFCEYAATWIEERPGLRPKTVQLYQYLLRCHLRPHFADRTVAEIKEAHVRRWRKKLIDAKVSAVTTAKAYRLLKAIMNTAVDDGLIRRNPCRIKGGGLEKSPERPVLGVAQVYALADAIDQRYRTLVLLGTFGSMRWGELAALRRSHIDLDERTIRVEHSLTELPGGGYSFGPPKSEAGQRTVPIPDAMAKELRWHLTCFTKPDDDALVFTSPEGSPLRHGNFRRRVWLKARDKAKLPAVHFHDLRHAGNTLTAEAGANLRELMERMGHSSTKAALIYLHSTDERQHHLADAVGELARDAMRKTAKPGGRGKRSGTNVARRRPRAS